VPASQTIPFFGGSHPELWEIERRCMDRDGIVIGRLNEMLPDSGRILDAGAGDGFTAERIAALTCSRLVAAVEPDRSMIRPRDGVRFVQAGAEALPLADGSCHAGYATWAYFFPSYHDPAPGLDEMRRVVQPGGHIVIADNAGDDELAAMAGHDVSTDPQWFLDRGFAVEVVETAYRFDSAAEAQRLLSFYFQDSEAAAHWPEVTVPHRVALFSRRA